MSFYLSIKPKETSATRRSIEGSNTGRSTMSDTSTGSHHGAGRYEIRIKGHLDSRWADWFDGLRLTNESDGTTIISGPVADQAALHGLLQKVRDVGLPLVSVTSRSTRTSPTHPPSHLDRCSPSAKGERHDRHRPNHSNETSPDELIEEDRADRGRDLLDHLHLDPDPRPVRPGAERSELHRRAWPGHPRDPRRRPGDHRGPRLHRHRGRAVPGGQAAERRRSRWASSARGSWKPPPSSLAW